MGPFSTQCRFGQRGYWIDCPIHPPRQYWMDAFYSLPCSLGNEMARTRNWVQYVTILAISTPTQH